MLYGINYLALRQAITPDRLLGRMTATMRFLTVAAAPLGSLAGGALATAIGLRGTLLTVGVLGLALVAGAVLWSPVRRHRTLPAIGGRMTHARSPLPSDWMLLLICGLARADDRAQALAGLDDAATEHRAAAVIWFAQNGTLADDKLILPRLGDEDAMVRRFAEQGHVDVVVPLAAMTRSTR